MELLVRHEQGTSARTVVETWKPEGVEALTRAEGACGVAGAKVEFEESFEAVKTVRRPTRARVLRSEVAAGCRSYWGPEVASRSSSDDTRLQPYRFGLYRVAAVEPFNVPGCSETDGSEVAVAFIPDGKTQLKLVGLGNNKKLKHV